MAPLFVSCDQLSHIYSPFTTRGMHSLPGKQGRNVPFVRPTKSISRAHIVVTAAPEHVINTDNDNSRDNRGVHGSRGLDEEYSAGLLAVHGGELSGRPKVSGTLYSSCVIGNTHLCHVYRIVDCFVFVSCLGVF